MSNQGRRLTRNLLENINIKVKQISNNSIGKLDTFEISKQDVPSSMEFLNLYSDNIITMKYGMTIEHTPSNNNLKRSLNINKLKILSVSLFRPYIRNKKQKSYYASYTAVKLCKEFFENI